MVPSQAVAGRLTALATAFGLGELSLPTTRRAKPIEETPFAENQLTSDPVRFARNVEIAVKAPQVAIGMPTIGWFFAACRAMGEVAEPEFGAAIKVPVLFVSASMDKVVSPRAIEVLAGELRAGAHVSVSGARHELMMEREPLREQFFAAFDAFVPGS
jgi:lysophospholipase